MNTCSRWMWVVAFALSSMTVMYVGDVYADLAGVGESAFQRVAPSTSPAGMSDASLLSRTEVPVPQKRASGQKSPSSAAKSDNKTQESLFNAIPTERIKECLDKGMYNRNGVETELKQWQRKALEEELARREKSQVTLTDHQPLANIDSKPDSENVGSRTNSLVFTVHHEKANVDIEVHCVDEQSRRFADKVCLSEMILTNFCKTNFCNFVKGDFFEEKKVGNGKKLKGKCKKALNNICKIINTNIQGGNAPTQQGELYFLANLSFRNEFNESHKTVTFIFSFSCGEMGQLMFANFKTKNPWCTWPFTYLARWWPDTFVEYTNDTNGVWFSEQQIRDRYLNNIKKGNVFNYRELRDALFNINSQPDVKVDATISGYQTNSMYYADVKFYVTESIPLHGMFEINNYGMEEIEEWQASFAFQYLNLWKKDHVLTLSPSISFGGELFSFAGSYMAPHYWLRGGNTTLYGGYSRLDVDNIVPRLDLEGTGGFVGLQHSEYLWDNDDSLVALSGGLLWRYIEDQYTAYSRKLNGRDAAILPLSLALSYTRKREDCLGGRNFATVQGVLNVMNTGDKLDEMWTDADKNYWILRWQTARLQPLPSSIFDWPWNWSIPDKHQWLLFLKLEGQYTTDTLIPVEKLSMGGYNCMRGYRTRGYLGDYGIYGTVELRTPILVNLFSSTMFGTTNESKQWDRLQFLTFVDWGWTAFNDLPSSYDDNEFIYSAGIGARWAVTKYMQLKCDIAFPLRDTDWADDDDMEVYFSAQFQF